MFQSIKATKILPHIRKAIYITQHEDNWRLHPILNKLPPNTSNPPPMTHLIKDMIKEIATIGKNARKEARLIYLIVNKKTTTNIQRAIKQYRNTLNTKPKRIHKAIFNKDSNPPLDNIKTKIKIY